MFGALKSITQLIGIEAGNLAGSQVSGFKKKVGSLGSNSDNLNSVGNEISSKVDFSQGSIDSSSFDSDLAILGKGFFVLFDDTKPASFDPDVKLSKLNSENKFLNGITSGNFSVNGNNVNVDINNDSLNDVFANIEAATGGNIVGKYDSVQNAVTITNTSGGSVNFGAFASSNIVNQLRLQNSSLQYGSGGVTYKLSNLPVGQPDGERTLYFTRKGDFGFNENGFLTNPQGLFVGSIDPASGELIKTDKKIEDGRGRITDEFNFAANGVLYNESLNYREGKQLALAKFDNIDGLVGSSKSGDVFEASSAAGKVVIDKPDRSDLGLIRDQALERSNSDPVESLSKLSVLQRFFPSTLSAVKVALTAQDELNNTIR